MKLPNVRGRGLLGLSALTLAGLLSWAAIGGEARSQSDESGWIELESDHFLLLTDTNEEKGLRLLGELEARYIAYRETVFPVQPRPFPVRVFLMDVRQDFEAFLPESVKTQLDLRNNAVPERSAYLFRGATDAFLVARDRGPDELIDDVGHSLGHLLLARSSLWQPFWLQEAVGEFVRMSGRGDGPDAVDPEDAYPLEDLFRIVPSDSFNDLSDGGAFRTQSYHVFRVLLEDHPEVLEAYLESLGETDGYDAAPELDDGTLKEIEARVLAFRDGGLPLPSVEIQPSVRGVRISDVDAALGDLASAAGLHNIARTYYQRSRSDAARLGLALLARRDEQTATGRRGFQQLARELPGSGLASYYFGSLEAATPGERDEQIAALERAIELMPLMGRAYASLARLRVEEGRPEDAIGLAQTAIDLEPEFADRAFEVVMTAELALGNADGAAAAAETAATLPHSDPETLEHYALLVPELYRTIESMRREADSNRLAELRREVEALTAERDPPPDPSAREALPVGLVHYEASSSPPPGVTEPRLVSGGLPEYTTDLRRRRIGGEVVLDIELDRQGRVSGTRVRTTDDDALSDAAVAAVRRWRFDPARENEESIPFSFRVTFTFDLQE